MILLRRSTMLAKKKEKDVIDQLLDQIDFHGMTAEELAGENGLLNKIDYFNSMLLFVIIFCQ